MQREQRSMEKIASEEEVVEKETSVPHWADAIERRDDEELRKRHHVEAPRRRQPGGTQTISAASMHSKMIARISTTRCTR